MKIYDGNSTSDDLLAHAYVLSRIQFNSGWSSMSYDDIQTVASSGNQMIVTFSSETFVARGFFANIYQNQHQDVDPLATFCTVTSPCNANEGHCYHDQQCSKGLKCGLNNCPDSSGYANYTNCCYEHCNQWLDLENGILTSPNYPNSYPTEEECSWTLTANDDQMITLQFLDFKVRFHQKSNQTYYPIVISFMEVYPCITELVYNKQTLS